MGLRIYIRKKDNEIIIKLWHFCNFSCLPLWSFTVLIMTTSEILKTKTIYGQCVRYSEYTECLLYVRGYSRAWEYNSEQSKNLHFHWADILVEIQTMKEAKFCKVWDADKCYRGNKGRRRIEDVEGGICNFKHESQEMLRRWHLSKDLKEEIELTVWLSGRRMFWAEEYKVQQWFLKLG